MTTLLWRGFSSACTTWNRVLRTHRSGGNLTCTDLPAGAVFHFRNTLINLLKVTGAKELVEPALVGDSATGIRQVYTITVNDVDAMCAELQSRGVTLLNGLMDRPLGIRTASFSDPTSNLWEIAK
jgi:uncharacterized glyoxalase superfamily protein PhnB